MAWKCAGCGKEAQDRVRNCDCATGVLFQFDGDKMRHEIKIDPREHRIDQIRDRVRRGGKLTHDDTLELLDLVDDLLKASVEASA